MKIVAKRNRQVGWEERRGEESARTINFRSFVNVKRITANILSNGSSESLMLVSTSNKCHSQLLPDLLRLKEGHTKQKDLACLSSASTPS